MWTILFEWFSNNFLKTNAVKYRLILHIDENNIDIEVIKNSNDKKLLEVSLNNRLGFDTVWLVPVGIDVP